MLFYFDENVLFAVIFIIGIEIQYPTTCSNKLIYCIISCLFLFNLISILHFKCVEPIKTLINYQIPFKLIFPLICLIVTKYFSMKFLFNHNLHANLTCI